MLKIFFGGGGGGGMAIKLPVHKGGEFMSRKHIFQLLAISKCKNTCMLGFTAQFFFCSLFSNINPLHYCFVIFLKGVRA